MLKRSCPQRNQTGPKQNTFERNTKAIFKYLADKTSISHQPINWSTERMVEIRTTLSSKSNPATERVIIVTSWQIRMLRRESKSVMKPKITSSPAKTTQPFNRSASAWKDQDWWDRHHELGWLEAHNAWHTTWDLIRKFGQWFSLPPRL